MRRGAREDASSRARAGRRYPPVAILVIAAATEGGTIPVLSLWFLPTRLKRPVTLVVGEGDEPPVGS